MLGSWPGDCKTGEEGQNRISDSQCNSPEIGWIRVSVLSFLSRLAVTWQWPKHYYTLKQTQECPLLPIHSASRLVQSVKRKGGCQICNEPWITLQSLLHTIFPQINASISSAEASIPGCGKIEWGFWKQQFHIVNAYGSCRECHETLAIIRNITPRPAYIVHGYMVFPVYGQFFVGPTLHQLY